MNAGELERVNIGRRSFVTNESLYAYVERLRGAGTSSAEDDPEASDDADADGGE
jgi:hypothetical protein